MIELRRRYNKVADTPSYSRLSKEYQEVEYLESTGKRLYIDLNLSLPNGFIFESYVNILSKSTDYGVVLGCHEVQAPYKRNYLTFPYINTNGYSIGCGDYSYVSGYAIYNDRVKIKASTLIGNNYLFINDNLYVENEYIGERSGRDIYLFASNNMEQFGASQFFIGRIEEAKIYDEHEELVRHLIPCYRISDHKPGMYDIVNDVFYINAGTDEFLVGPDVHYNIPFEYQQVEFLEVAKANTVQLPVNQATFIDTGFIANRNTSFYIDYEFKGVYSITLQNQVGAGAGDSGRFYISIDNNKIGCAIGVGTTTDIPIEINKRFQAELNAYKDTLTVLVDGAEYVRNIDTDSFVSSLLPISLFGRRENSSTISFCFGARVYACVIKNQDDPVRNLIPCYRKADNVAGMYDLVSGKFYTNAGTGEFDVGPYVIG